MWKAYRHAVEKKLPQADIAHDRFHISQHLEEHLSEAFAEQFSELKQADLKVSKAWAIKARFRDFWDHGYAGWARRHFDKWIALAIRCRLQPSKEEARMLKNHLPHILTCFKHRISNAAAEGLSSKIQTVKVNARG